MGAERFFQAALVAKRAIPNSDPYRMFHQ
jgi:hypothetical protein